MVTATDVAVLCGADSKACMRLYDSKPIHNELCHESGMRVMIGYVARVAAQFGLGTDVELSVSYMHYMRTFIRFTHGAAAAYGSLAKMGISGIATSAATGRWSSASCRKRPNAADAGAGWRPTGGCGWVG